MKVQNRKCIFCLHDCVFFYFNFFFIIIIHGEEIFSACDFLRLLLLSLVCVFSFLWLFFIQKLRVSIRWTWAANTVNLYCNAF
jgi:hypothetical protein